ncbi:FAD-binding oxidoreductase [Microbacterium sp. X-17]|uniref:FAD-binding oxidoreductase n=1 Tax=Microbacterium sp. X-17 TaxID=3144404 RepID=UPI0031F5CBC9
MTDPVSAGFERGFQGEVLLAGDDGYETRRWAVNRRFDHRPAVIARCLGVSDVVQAVRVARDRGLEIAVRGGGHHAGGLSTTDGLLIDLSLMRGTRVSEATRTLWLQGGALMGDVQLEATRVGLGAVIGVSSMPGAGVILGGGLGYLAPRYGWGCDNILEAELVTADGEVVIASADENADLFRGVKGAAANFGVVTSLRIATYPVPPVVLSGDMLWNGPENAARAMRWLRDFQQVCSEDLAFYPGVQRTQASDWIPAEYAGPVGLTMMLCHGGSPETAEAEIAEIRRAIPPDVDTVGPLTFRAVHLAKDAAFDDRAPLTAEDDEVVSELTDEVIDLLVGDAGLADPDAAGDRTAQFYPENRAIAQVSPEDGALGLRGPRQWGIHTASYYSSPDDTRVEQGWSSGLCAAVRRTSVGTGSSGSANWVSEYTEERARGTYAGTYDVLADLKKRWDPQNVFHRNANVLPA